MVRKYLHFVDLVSFLLGLTRGKRARGPKLAGWLNGSSWGKIAKDSRI